MSSLDDRNLLTIDPLPAPADLKTAHPISKAAARTVLRARTAIRDSLHGRDTRRLVAIVGPCSLHDPEAALEYAKRLKPLATELEGELIVVMRTYFEKPRTTVGWKGLVNDPRLDGSCRVDEGLSLARRLLLSINDLGVPCATEFLDPFAPQYLADAIAWAAIGARTTESQTHREMASGLSMPVGFKNGTGGSAQVAIDARTAASAPHTFLGVRADGTAAVVRTAGNPDTHVVLRGGGGRTNYDHASIGEVADKIGERAVLVDCSHANSKKDPALQGDALRDVARQVRSGSKALLGVMIESHLEEGRQSWKPGAALRYGVSITDACIGFEETDGLLRELAASVRSVRTGRGGRRITDAA